MQIVKVGRLTILNDTYNSNPESALAALNWLSFIPAKGRKIAVLADMLELGDSAKGEHRKIGKKVAESKINYLFTFGDLAREIAAAADSKVKSESFDDMNYLCEKILQTASSGDVVLVKGSRGMKMERVVDVLRKEFVHHGAQ
jgi:UDP-N-acetylmuramyl pentapeptide synthase